MTISPLHRRSKPIGWLGVALAAWTSAAAAGTDDGFRAPLDQRLEALTALVAEGAPAEPAAGGDQTRADLEQRLDAVRRALDGDRPYLALWRFAGTAPRVEIWRYRRQAAALVAGGAEGFAGEWRQQAAIVEQARRWLEGDACAGAPAALRALAEAALNQVGRYYQAAHAFAALDDVGAGVAYVGVARGRLELGRLCAALPPAPSSTALPPPGDRRQRLEAATDAAYARPGAAIDRHRDFIHLNASIKALRELEAAGLAFGAAYTYLDARLQLAMITAEGEPPPIAALAPALDAAAARLRGLAGDHSLAQLFLERAKADLDAGDEQDLPAARAVAGEVLPAYLQWIDGDRP